MSPSSLTNLIIVNQKKSNLSMPRLRSSAPPQTASFTATPITFHHPAVSPLLFSCPHHDTAYPPYAPRTWSSSHSFPPRAAAAAAAAAAVAGEAVEAACAVLANTSSAKLRPPDPRAGEGGDWGEALFGAGGFIFFGDEPGDVGDVDGGTDTGCCCGWGGATAAAAGKGGGLLLF